jgi:hypothetical protein
MKPTGSFRRKFGRWIVAILITVGLGYGIYRLTTWVFTIHTIEIVGEHAIVTVDEKRISKNLLFFPSDVFRTQILQSSPALADVQFEKKFPGTLRIIPILRTPAAILVSSDRVVLVDEQGIVLADGDGGLHLPVLNIPTEAFRVGQALADVRVQLALALVKGLAPDVVIHSVIYENSSYLRAKSEKLDIIVTQEKSAEETMATLQLLVSGFRIKGTLPKVVDLRFDKPIVIF